MQLSSPDTTGQLHHNDSLLAYTKIGFKTYFLNTFAAMSVIMSMAFDPLKQTLSGSKNSQWAAYLSPTTIFLAPLFFATSASCCLSIGSKKNSASFKTPHTTIALSMLAFNSALIVIDLIKNTTDANFIILNNANAISRALLPFLYLFAHQMAKRHFTPPQPAREELRHPLLGGNDLEAQRHTLSNDLTIPQRLNSVVSGLGGLTPLFYSISGAIFAFNNALGSPMDDQVLALSSGVTIQMLTLVSVGVLFRYNHGTNVAKQLGLGHKNEERQATLQQASGIAMMLTNLTIAAWVSASVFSDNAASLLPNAVSLTPSVMGLILLSLSCIVNFWAGNKPTLSAQLVSANDARSPMPDNPAEEIGRMLQRAVSSTNDYRLMPKPRYEPPNEYTAPSVGAGAGAGAGAGR